MLDDVEEMLAREPILEQDVKIFLTNPANDTFGGYSYGRGLRMGDPIYRCKL